MSRRHKLTQNALKGSQDFSSLLDATRSSAQQLEAICEQTGRALGDIYPMRHLYSEIPFPMADRLRRWAVDDCKRISSIRKHCILNRCEHLLKLLPLGGMNLNVRLFGYNYTAEALLSWLKAEQRLFEELDPRPENLTDQWIQQHWDGALLGEAREKSGLTLAALAEKLDVSVDTVKHWIYGESSPHPKRRAVVYDFIKDHLNASQKVPDRGRFGRC
jgi:DNA-binding transcriptional regulator YiaG